MPCIEAVAMSNVSSRSRLKKNCQRLGLVSSREADVSVSAIYVSCQDQFPDGHADGAVCSVNGL